MEFNFSGHLAFRVYMSITTYIIKRYELIKLTFNSQVKKRNEKRTAFRYYTYFKGRNRNMM